MSKVLVTEGHLEAIADAIRAKNGSYDTYSPGEMAAAIRAIPTSGIIPAGTVNISENGTVDVTQYASAAVNVQPALQAKSVTQNGTVTPDSGYDGLSSVVVNVPTGGGDVIFVDSKYSTSGSFSYDETITIPDNDDYTVYVQMFVNSTHTVKINGTDKPVTSQYTSYYVYLWNFSQTFSAGDIIQITASSSGSPMVTVVVKRTNSGN